MTKILVTGGTGVLGRAVLRELLDRDHEVRVAGRGARPEPDGFPDAAADWATVNYDTAAGLAAALDGVRTVVHCATSFRGGEVQLARTLTTAALAAGAPHLVYISIVGVDRIPLGYYRDKLAAERVFEGSGLPWTVLRATQFHDLVYRLLGTAARLPVLPLPAGFRCQPVEAGEVAGRLADLAEGGAAGRAPDFGGPEIQPFAELARTYLRGTGRRRPLLPVPVPGAIARGYREGAHLAEHGPRGRRTFAEYVHHRHP
ncbi:SDR family oxidoreductase [Amycolatopsis aidingensis]|uniref:SDR family oxidoreductase n=1 Tax=Amycolatopsis aidingensis TaxID=2842453 RepID=UPI001C0BC9C3|nr:SDR family oxidoreductase [Amycolatopsis aidingensis]